MLAIEKKCYFLIINYFFLNTIWHFGKKKLFRLFDLLQIASGEIIKKIYRKLELVVFAVTDWFLFDFQFKKRYKTRLYTALNISECPQKLIRQHYLKSLICMIIDYYLNFNNFLKVYNILFFVNVHFSLSYYCWNSSFSGNLFI